MRDRERKGLRLVLTLTLIFSVLGIFAWLINKRVGVSPGSSATRQDGAASVLNGRQVSAMEFESYSRSITLGMPRSQVAGCFPIECRRLAGLRSEDEPDSMDIYELAYVHGDQTKVVPTSAIPSGRDQHKYTIEYLLIYYDNHGSAIRIDRKIYPAIESGLAPYGISIDLESRHIVVDR